jgi:hypothetical protein
MSAYTLPYILGGVYRTEKCCPFPQGKTKALTIKCSTPNIFWAAKYLSAINPMIKGAMDCS